MSDEYVGLCDECGYSVTADDSFFWLDGYVFHNYCPPYPEGEVFCP